MKKSLLTILLVAISIVGFGCGSLSKAEKQALDVEYRKEQKEEKFKKIIMTKFVDPYEFADTEVVDAKELDGIFVAGIVNHHALAMDLQARFFKSLKESRPDIKSFIILSPDHFLAGDLVSTHRFTYATPAGEVVSRELEVDGVYLAKDINTFSNEHGVGALVPFVAREFPKAQIVPIYIRPEATSYQLEKLGQDISKQIDDFTFVIVSSDMSHYLIDTEARENDKKTLEWIRSNDWEKLEIANDDYTDSAQSFVVLEAFFASLKQQPNFELLDYAVSTDYGADFNETTSYINGFYVIPADS
jgi:AmmeMemoRadiSam system protein B